MVWFAGRKLWTGGGGHGRPRGVPGCTSTRRAALRRTPTTLTHLLSSVWGVLNDNYPTWKFMLRIDVLHSGNQIIEEFYIVEGKRWQVHNADQSNKRVTIKVQLNSEKIWWFKALGTRASYIVEYSNATVSFGLKIMLEIEGNWNWIVVSIVKLGSQSGRENKA